MKSLLFASMNKINTRTSWLCSLLFICSLVFSNDGLAQRGKQDDEEKPKKPLISQDEYNKLLMWLVDEKYENILYKCGWSPLEGQRFQSRVTQSIVSGVLTYDNGVFSSKSAAMPVKFIR